MFITKKFKNNIANVRNTASHTIRITDNIVKNGLLKSYLLLFLSEKKLPTTNWQLTGQLLLSPFKIFWIINLWVIGNCVRLHKCSGYIPYNIFRDKEYEESWRNEHHIDFEGFYIFFFICQILNIILFIALISSKICGCDDTLADVSILQLLGAWIILAFICSCIPMILSLVIGIFTFIYIQIKNFCKFIGDKTTKEIKWD